MQGCSQHLPAHDHGTHDEYTDMVSEIFKYTWTIFRLFSEEKAFDGLTDLCILQGADAAGTAEDHRGSDEEATGKPKKRQLC